MLGILLSSILVGHATPRFASTYCATALLTRPPEAITLDVDTLTALLHAEALHGEADANWRASLLADLAQPRDLHFVGFVVKGTAAVETLLNELVARAEDMDEHEDAQFYVDRRRRRVDLLPIASYATAIASLSLLVPHLPESGLIHAGVFVSSAALIAMVRPSLRLLLADYVVPRGLAQGRAGVKQIVALITPALAAGTGPESPVHWNLSARVTEEFARNLRRARSAHELEVDKLSASNHETRTLLKKDRDQSELHQITTEHLLWTNPPDGAPVLLVVTRLKAPTRTPPPKPREVPEAVSLVDRARLPVVP